MVNFLKTQKRSVAILIVFMLLFGGIVYWKSSSGALHSAAPAFSTQAVREKGTSSAAAQSAEMPGNGCNIYSFYQTSHAFGATVSGQQVTIQGSVYSPVPLEWLIIQMQNGQIFTGTVTTGNRAMGNNQGYNWSVTIILPNTGSNYFTILAKPTGCPARELPFMLVRNGANPVQTSSGSGTTTNTGTQTCVNPITSLLITTPANGIVTMQPTTIAGTVNGNATKVDVKIGNQTFTDTTIVNGQWSVIVNGLVPGVNPVTLKAIHGSLNSGCHFTSSGTLTYNVPQVYDPSVEVTCAQDPANTYTCGETLTCTAIFKNTPSNVAVTHFTGGTFVLANGYITEIVSYTNGISCQLSESTGMPQANCSGPIAANSTAAVVFKVQLYECVCQGDLQLELYSFMSVSPTDPKLINNFNSRSQTISDSDPSRCD